MLGVAGGAKLTTTPMTDLTGLVCIHWSERTHAKCRRRAVVSTSVVAIGVCGCKYGHLEAPKEKRDLRPVAASRWFVFVPGRHGMCAGRPESLRAVGVVETRRDPFVRRLRYDVMGRLSVG